MSVIMAEKYLFNSLTINIKTSSCVCVCVCNKPDSFGDFKQLSHLKPS